MPVLIGDVNRNEYPEALKEYREEKTLNRLIGMFEKEQPFYTKIKGLGLPNLYDSNPARHRNHHLAFSPLPSDSQ